MSVGVCVYKCVCVCVPCTTPGAHDQRTRCSPGGPAASLAAACCSVSPWQRGDSTPGLLDNSSDYSRDYTSQAASQICQSEGEKSGVSNQSEVGGGYCGNLAKDTVSSR